MLSLGATSVAYVSPFVVQPLQIEELLYSRDNRTTRNLVLLIVMNESHHLAVVLHRFQKAFTVVLTRDSVTCNDTPNKVLSAEWCGVAQRNLRGEFPWRITSNRLIDNPKA